MRRNALAFLFIAFVAIACAQAALAQRAFNTEDGAIAKLEGVTIDTFEHENKPLKEVLREIAKKADVAILVDTKTVDEKAVTVTIELSNVTALNALDLTLKLKGLVRQFTSGVIWVTTDAAAKAAPVVSTIVYDVRDITNVIQNFEAPEVKLKEDTDEAGARIKIADPDPKEKVTDIDELMDLIQEQIEPDSWGENGIAITKLGGTLVIACTADMHKRIRAMLDQLRMAK